MKPRVEGAEAGREVLLETAGVYRSVVTYKELAEEVQQRSGVRTRALMTHWIGGVLGVIASDCARRGEPLLTALCVKQDGTVGDGYVKAVVDTGGSVPDDLDQHAAKERLACHRAFGAVLPTDGGRPALTPQVAHARAQQARRRAADTSAATCPTCHIQLPASGVCDQCA